MKKAGRALWLILGGCVSLVCLYAYQSQWRLYESLEPYDDIAAPADGKLPAEWTFTRLMYPSAPYVRFESFRVRRDWRDGGTSWTEDYPRADRHFATALRRLSRVNARSLEQPVNPDDGEDLYNWPWLYAGLPGAWDLTDNQAKTIRDYLERGGFFFADDFWGPAEWEIFETGIKKIFPGREIVDLPNSEPLFHTVYDLDDRYQIPGQWATRSGQSYRDGGSVPHWMGVYDDKGRVMIAIAFNSDIGDSWEFADDPSYPEKFSALGIRIGVNYVVYSFTH